MQLDGESQFSPAHNSDARAQSSDREEGETCPPPTFSSISRSTHRKTVCVLRVCSKCGIFLAFLSVFVCLKAEALCFLLMCLGFTHLN